MTPTVDKPRDASTPPTLTDVRVVLCTCPDEAIARSVASRAVEEDLAACVTTVPGVTSTYVWKGDLHEDRELLLIIKTDLARFEALRQRILELHPYQVPEIIALPVTEGLRSYLAWVAGGGDD